jgi:hypothetical protein
MSVKKPQSNHNHLSRTLLCNNIINFNKCDYGSKCVFAHKREEQKMSPTRELAYNIIKNPHKSYNTIIVTEELIRTFYTMTKLCEKCVKWKCTGGYNCKNGTFDESYRVCWDDLHYGQGQCMNNNCKLQHISARIGIGIGIGLKPRINRNNLNIKKSQPNIQTDSDQNIKQIANVNIPLLLPQLQLQLQLQHQHDTYTCIDDDISIDELDDNISDISCDEYIFE